MKFDTTNKMRPHELDDLLLQLGKDQGYGVAEWDRYLHSFCSSLSYKWEEN